MRDLLGWNLYLFRWSGVEVRVHAFFFALIVVAAYLSGGSSPSSLGEYRAYGTAIVAIWFVSLLIHEAGHVFAARRLGGHANQVVIWPLGGFVATNVRREPPFEVIESLSGPAANLAACMAMVPALWYFGAIHVTTLFNPLTPPEPVATITWPAVVELVFWCNWLLVVANLTPALPLDGGRTCLALLRPLGRRPAISYVARMTKVVALALFVTAWLVADKYGFTAVVLSMLGIFLFFGAKRETDRLHENSLEEALFGADLPQTYLSFEESSAAPPKPRVGPLRKWIDRRRAARLRQAERIEHEEDRRVDSILARLGESGLEALSPEEKALLDRVSVRYRNRLAD